MSPTHEARLRELERRLLTVDHGRCLIHLRRAVQQVAPDQLEVAGRLDQLERPLACRLGRAAQRSARGGELRAVRKVGHGRRGAEEGAKVGHLFGTQSALLERQLLGVLGQVVQLLPTDCASCSGSSSAPEQLALGVAAGSALSPRLHGRLASKVTPSREMLPSCTLHCRAGSSGCGGGGALASDTVGAPSRGQAPRMSAAEQSRASAAIDDHRCKTRRRAVCTGIYQRLPHCL